jgi:CheY-like chemotaxis protein
MNKILVVDDEPTLRDAYKLLLSSSGYSVSTAIDGKDALTEYNKHTPDLILLDMLMPNLDGIGFLKMLDLANHPQVVKIIIFSNLSTSEKINAAMELGASKHLTKSQMTPKQLLEEIKMLLLI